MVAGCFFLFLFPFYRFQCFLSCPTGTVAPGAASVALALSPGGACVRRQAGKSTTSTTIHRGCDRAIFRSMSRGFFVTRCTFYLAPAAIVPAGLVCTRGGLMYLREAFQPPISQAQSSRPDTRTQHRGCCAYIRLSCILESILERGRASGRHLVHVLYQVPGARSVVCTRCYVSCLRLPVYPVPALGNRGTRYQAIPVVQVYGPLSCDS